MCSQVGTAQPPPPPPDPADVKRTVRTYRVTLDIDIRADSCAVEAVKFVKAENIRNVIEHDPV